LGWSEGRLSFRGKLRYADWQELSKIDSDASFLSALDYLYLASNMNWASKVKDAKWLETVKSKYAVDQVQEVTINKILNIGLLVSMRDNQAGFIRVSGAGDGLKEGDVIKAKVVGFNEERQQVNLSLAIPENSALKKFAVGQQVNGVVDNLKDYGAFVNLGLGNSGLIHKSNMGRRVNYPSEVLSKGDKVRVEIIKIEDSGGKLKISLRLISVL
jgi:small subunit ribosomal protein S1